jgi:hypothetical protein
MWIVQHVQNAAASIIQQLKRWDHIVNWALCSSSINFPFKIKSSTNYMPPNASRQTDKLGHR